MLVHGEFGFRSYRSADGRSLAVMTFVASRIGPDILYADVVVTWVQEPETIRPQPPTRDATRSLGRSL